MPFPVTTERLHIDYLAEPDIPAFLEYRQNPAIARLQGWEPSYSEADARQLLSRQPAGGLPAGGAWAQLAVRDAATARLHGDLGLHVLAERPDTYELGCTITPASQGLGIATEAVFGVMAFLFDEVAAHRVVAFCDARNTSVHQLVGRVGMRHESRQVEAEFAEGEWTTVDGYAMLGAEWAARRARSGASS